jgi:hypothetical protein
LAAGVKQRLHQPDGPRSLAALGWAVPAALAATLLVLLLRPGIWPPGAGDATDCCADRPKGTAASLMIYRNTPSGSETLADNDAARTGDVVRIGYRAADGGFGAIVSVDGRGVLTRHLPVDGDQAAPLEPARLVLLDRAFELDDAPTVERFYFITAPSRFEMPAVLDAVRRASSDIGRGVSQPLALPDGFTHVVFSLRKDSRP